MNHRYDLRRLESKYNGKCKGCGEYYDEGESVLWGKVDGASMTFHNERCIPRSLQLSWPPERAEAEREPAESSRQSREETGGHAAVDPQADTHVASRLILDRLEDLRARSETLGGQLSEVRALVVSLGALIEKQPF